MTTTEIANRLAELCRQGQFETAQRELYAQNATSTEPPASKAPMASGLDAIIEKGHTFMAMLEAYYSTTVSEPVIAGNYFAVSMGIDATMKGKGRSLMQEICVYQVADGKIIADQFFA